MSFEVIHPRELKKYLGRREAVIVDLRDREEYLDYHLEGAVNIPYEELSSQSQWLARYPVILFYCDRGNISLMAARDLREWPNQVIAISGGVNQFRNLH